MSNLVSPYMNTQLCGSANLIPAKIERDKHVEVLEENGKREKKIF